MLRKLPKTNFALLFFTLILLLSIIGILMMVSIYHPTYAIYATKVGEKPSNYFVLDNPDKYVLEAMSNQHSGTFNSLDYIQIDELAENYGVHNIEYNSTYYAIGILYGDNFPPPMLPLILLAGIVVSVTVIIVLASLKVTRYFRKLKE